MLRLQSSEKTHILGPAYDLRLATNSSRHTFCLTVYSQRQTVLAHKQRGIEEGWFVYGDKPVWPKSSAIGRESRPFEMVRYQLAAGLVKEALSLTGLTVSSESWAKASVPKGMQFWSVRRDSPAGSQGLPLGASFWLLFSEDTMYGGGGDLISVGEVTFLSSFSFNFYMY